MEGDELFEGTLNGVDNKKDLTHSGANSRPPDCQVLISLRRVTRYVPPRHEASAAPPVMSAAAAARTHDASASPSDTSSAVDSSGIE